MHQTKLHAETRAQGARFTRIGNRAVQAAIEENRRLGIPNAFSFRGRIVYELPDGTLTETDPFATPAGDGA